MKKKNSRTKLWLLVLLLLLVALAGTTFAKYARTFEVKTGTVQLDVTLAANLSVRESQVQRNADGTYETIAEPATDGTFSYVLIPGVDIPKDAQVFIEKKTPIPAYLYLTVTSTTNAAVTYTLADHWQLVPDSTDTYVYCTVNGNTKTAAPLTRNNEDMTIPILADNLIHVSQTLLGETPAECSITFTATLTEVLE